MKKKICTLLAVLMMLVCGSVGMAAGEFDSVVPEEMDKDELVNAYNELREAYNTLCDEDALADESKNLFDPLIETDIVFEEASPFFDSDQNYRIIKEYIDDFKIEELKTAIGNYLTEHQDDSVILNEILNVLNEYGDFQNLVTEVDSFSGDKNIFYDGYVGIDQSHFIYPHCDGIGYTLRMGFVRNDWLFAEDMILKRMSDDLSDGIWFRGDSFDFERDTLGNGTIIEYKEERLYDDDVDYLLEDLSEDTVIRFEAENGEKMDYTLTDTDKAALQNVAKYVKIKDCLSDIHSNSELYYPEIPDGSIISGRSNGTENPFSFEVKLSGKSSDEENFNKYANFVFDLTNNYEKTITEINGTATIINSQGKQIMRLYFNFTGLEILPGDTLTDKTLYFECTSYKDEEMELYNIPYEEISFVYIPSSVVFSDGTSEQF